MPASPRVPEVVPVEVLNPNTLAGAIKVAPAILLNTGVEIFPACENQGVGARSLALLSEGGKSALKDCAGIFSE